MPAKPPEELLLDVMRYQEQRVIEETMTAWGMGDLAGYPEIDTACLNLEKLGWKPEEELDV